MYKLRADGQLLQHLDVPNNTFRGIGLPAQSFRWGRKANYTVLGLFPRHELGKMRGKTSREL